MSELIDIDHRELAAAAEREAADQPLFDARAMVFEETTNLFLDPECQPQGNRIGIGRADDLHSDRHSGAGRNTDRHIDDG